MIPVLTLGEIERIELERRPRRPTIIILCRPDAGMSADLCSQFGYIHADSGSACSIYPAGFMSSNGCGYDPFPKKYAARRMEDYPYPCSEWWYSDRAFSELKKALEWRMNVEYRGGFSVAALDPGEGYQEVFNYEDSILLDGDRLVADGVVSSPIELMQRLINSARLDPESDDLLGLASSLQKRSRSKSRWRNVSDVISALSVLFNLGEGSLGNYFAS